MRDNKNMDTTAETDEEIFQRWKNSDPITTCMTLILHEIMTEDQAFAFLKLIRGCESHRKLALLLGGSPTVAFVSR